MSKQLIFFISDRINVEVIANKIVGMGYEVMKWETDANGTGKLIHYPATMQDFSAQWFKIRLHKPMYGPVKTLFDPHIEWFQGAVLSEKKEIVSGRLYLNTSHFSEYDQQLQDLLLSDYSQLCKEVKKIVPRRTLNVRDVLIKQRMDELTIQLLNAGYDLIF